MATFFEGRAAAFEALHIVAPHCAPKNKQKKQRSFATDQDPLGENYICDHCDPLLRDEIIISTLKPPLCYYK